MLALLRDGVALFYIVHRILEVLSGAAAIPRLTPTSDTEIVAAGIVTATIASAAIADFLVTIHVWILIEDLTMKMQRRIGRLIRRIKGSK
jgi:hypothetical protein